jgi:hypothetical protein
MNLGFFAIDLLHFPKPILGLWIVAGNFEYDSKCSTILKSCDVGCLISLHVTA